MADKQLTPKELMQLFNTAQTKLIFEDLLSKKPKLNTIAADLCNSLTKYGIDGDRFMELFTIHLDDTKNYTFEYNCAAVFVNDILIKEKFYHEGKDFINHLVEGPQSAEGFKNFALSPEQLYSGAQRSGMSVSAVKEQMQKYLNDMKSPIWDSYRNQLKKLPTDFPCIRGDFDRGILEYCQEGDIDYAFSAIKSNIEEEPEIYTSLARAYSGMEKDELKDELIELILKLLPTIYTYSPSLIALHSNPEKAKKIYEAARQARGETKPDIPKMTKDIFGCSLYATAPSASSTTSTTSTTGSSRSGGGGGWFIGAAACVLLAFANAGMDQTEAFIPFIGIGVVLAVIGIIKKFKS